MTNEEFQRLVLEKLDSLETGQKNLEIKYEEIKTTNLSEFKEEVILELDNIKSTISKIEIITADNWGDIARLKSIK